MTRYHDTDSGLPTIACDTFARTATLEEVKAELARLSGESAELMNVIRWCHGHAVAFVNLVALGVTAGELIEAVRGMLKAQRPT